MITEETGVVTLNHRFKEDPSYTGKKMKINFILMELYSMQHQFNLSLTKGLESSSGKLINAFHEKQSKEARRTDLIYSQVHQNAIRSIDQYESFIKEMSTQKVSLYYKVLPEV
ncbi:hypothetical protein [Alkalicoccobacillus porphyridii]|uniref:Uncharacterized protein n=1 Tax=Alkalicoccobacillus porphyridii TaxID=2597270 RepID=A0A553ZW76_9BACI|nr:hypothetical protein [Alkalicoccobacillus porphyridii]TSB45728.1 hypothetical protein FN960_14670 [Alkalicoccobacillus porphyridii]